ncbi:ATP-binding protein [Zoogloea sp.]|uniref:ATP-binding protein n=1 Tax=Zoogloea sp. TaxID=49181 RepID=UPI0035AF5DC7
MSLQRLLPFGFVALYVALDAASFIHPLHGLNITPWNPAPALALVFLLREGRRARGWVIVAVLASELLVRGVPLAWWRSLLSALILAGGYLALGEVLRRRMSPGSLLDDRAALLGWMVPVVAGTFINSLAFLSGLHVLGLLPAGGWRSGVLQFWVGDMVGIAVAMPLAWWLTGAQGRRLLKAALFRWETLGYVLLSLGALWVAFGVGGGSGFKLFYWLFVPIAWAAARQGMAGAIVSATLLQIGVIAVVQWLDFSAVTVAELQMLAFVMALTGFLIGGIVDEQRRTSDELRQTLRLAAAGEMAAALAHELNQPLTALGAYAAAYDALKARGEAGARMEAAVEGMRGEARRAGNVVQRLRDFFRTGATRLEDVALPGLIDAACARYRRKAEEAQVVFSVATGPDIRLLADPLQLEVVLRNLLSNAFDAVLAPGVSPRRVSVGVELLAGERVCIRVEDSGPGLDAQKLECIFESFCSDKASGMGLGLAISRAIAEAHGGRLWAEAADHGLFRLTLPIREAP